MNAAKKSHHAALLKATGFEDAPPLTLDSTDGEMPQGREISLSWLTGAILTGLTSVLLMGAALYVSFKGQDTFSTPYEALQLEVSESAVTALSSLSAKASRARPIALTRSEFEIVEASIREDVEGVARIRRQPFVRIKATLATSATSLSEDIPAYDPIELLRRNQPIEAADVADSISTDIYGADVEGEVAVRLASLPLAVPPEAAITDTAAAEYVRKTLEGAYADIEGIALGYAPEASPSFDFGAASGAGIDGVAENVSVVPMSRLPGDGSAGRTERVLTIHDETLLADELAKNGFSDSMVLAISGALRSIFPSATLAADSHLRILLGPSRVSDTQIPYRMSIYSPNDAHEATVALTDSGRYVLGLPPPSIEFSDEDTEEISVDNLPTLYRSIYETGRKHDLDDETIERIVSMFAYDVDLTRRVAPGESIEILQSEPDAEGRKELLYVGLAVGNARREMFRFHSDDGVIDYYDADGQTGKKFLIRRPLEGSGTLRSRFGMRLHPIFKTYTLHSGVDLAAPTGTEIYASGDGVVERAQWISGYGRAVEIKHANGYTTMYAHMTRIADAMTPGTRVRQGQLIGFVGSTGYSTGPHLHFEIRINGRPVDPLSVRLPRDKTLPNQFAHAFEQTVEQIHELMARDAEPVQVAAAE
ncbi:MAG: M23 family metallopeptidase [Cucumibacter sp.]